MDARAIRGASGGLLVLMAGVAAAEARCPVSGDLERGVAVDFSNGDSAVYRTGPGPGLIEAVTVAADGGVWRVLLTRGDYTLRFETNGPDGAPVVVEFIYDVEPADLPVPEPSTRWSSRMKMLGPTGAQDIRANYEAGPLTTETLAGCDFEAIEVTQVAEAAATAVTVTWWLPELGLSVVRRSERPGVPPQALEVVAIEAVE